MNESSRNPSEYELAPDQARELVELQQAICEKLFQEEVTSVALLEPELVDEVRLHVITCQENHHPISGLMIEDA